MGAYFYVTSTKRSALPLALCQSARSRVKDEKPPGSHLARHTHVHARVVCDILAWWSVLLAEDERQKGILHERW